MKWFPPEVSSCCYFVSLKTGVKLFGFLSLFGCLLLALMSAWRLALLIKYVANTDFDVRIDQIILSVDILVQTTQVVTAVLLLLGVYQDKPKLLLPWLVSTVVNAVSEVLFVSSLPGQIFNFSHAATLNWVILILFALVDDVYGWLVVFSYYRSISQQSANIV